MNPTTAPTDVIITTPSDCRLARRDWIEAGYEQSEPFDTEPIFVVVPVTASDARLEGLAKQFEVPIEDLIACRQKQRDAKELRVIGREMAPRFREGTPIITEPIGSRADLHRDSEVVVRFRSGHALLRQVNVVTNTAVELVDCWRADRVQVAWSDIERVDRVVFQGNPSSSPDVVTAVDTHVPGWVRHQQIGRAFIGPDRSRQPWSTEDTSEVVDAAEVPQ